MAKPKIHFFYGPDVFRAFSTLKQWQAVFSQKNPNGLIRNLEKGDKPHLLSELSGSSSLFNPVSLTIIGDPFGDEPLLDSEDFLLIAEKGVSDDNHFILWHKGSLDKRLTLTKKIAALGKAGKINLHTFEELTGEEALKFLAQELKTRGLKIKRDAGEMLRDFATGQTGFDSWYAHHALEQLAAYADGKETVETSDILAVVSPLKYEDVFFPLLESFARQDKRSFLKNLDVMIRNSESEHELLGLISALFEKVKNLLLVKNLEEERLNAGQIDDLLGYKKGRSRYLLAECKSFTKQQLNELLDKIIQIEYNVKRGNTVLAPALSQLV